MSYSGDRAEHALRIVELESRIAEYKVLGALDRDGERWPWGGLSNERKHFEIMFDMKALHLDVDASAHKILAREVDLIRLGWRPEEVEDEREAAWRKPQEPDQARPGTPDREVTGHAREIGEQLDKHPLYLAARLGDLQEIRALFGIGWEPNCTGARRATALHGAAAAGQTDAARLLLDRGAKIEARMWGGMTPLLHAAAEGHSATVALLIERGADVNARHNNYSTPLHFAAKAGHAGVVEQIIAAGADVNASELDDWTPLHVAMFHERGEIVAKLMAAGADPHVTNNKGHTPLQMPFKRSEYFPTGKSEPARTGAEHQVWHDRGWPQSRLDQMLGGCPPSAFPADYFHAADVRAGSLREAVQLTTSEGHLLNGGHQPWDTNKDVRSYTPKPFVPRDTDTGDVIVDPQGVAYRVEGHGFNEVKATEQPLPSPGELAKDDYSGPESPGPERGHNPGRGR